MAGIQLTVRKTLEDFERRLTGELTEKLTERELPCLVEDFEDLD